MTMLHGMACIPVYCICSFAAIQHVQPYNKIFLSMARREWA
ncbi:Uncharacterized protein APZ42_008660 [Daphnia magna]|uniref:Uncharacterized protein n=1 Tax=Daphnia magna TaxID=35525 RepID=A0A164EHY9_9CRUS|nr:Uncharacterized protein APZ42_008660 [Daphnia magna]